MHLERSGLADGHAGISTFGGQEAPPPPLPGILNFGLTKRARARTLNWPGPQAQIMVGCAAIAPGHAAAPLHGNEYPPISLISPLALLSLSLSLSRLPRGTKGKWPFGPRSTTQHKEGPSFHTIGVESVHSMF